MNPSISLYRSNRKNNIYRLYGIAGSPPGLYLWQSVYHLRQFRLRHHGQGHQAGAENLAFARPGLGLKTALLKSADQFVIRQWHGETVPFDFWLLFVDAVMVGEGSAERRNIISRQNGFCALEA